MHSSLRTTVAISLAWAASALLGVACRKHDVPAVVDAGGASPSASASSPAAMSSVENARRLALTPPKGQTPVDALIEQHQASAARLPGKNDFWVLLGRDWIRKARESGDPGYYLNAEGAAQVALANAANDKLAMGLHAMVLLNDHRFEEARVAAEKAVAVDVGDPNAYAPLSDALLELGRVEDAEKATQTMVDLKPNLPSYSRVAHLRWLRGDRQGALSAYKLAVSAGADRRDPEPTAWVLTQAAWIFWHVGDFEGALAGVDSAMKLVADYPPALVLSARVALAKGKANEAASLLERAYKASPLVETAWLLGDARAAAGDAKGADAAYADVVKNGELTDHRTLALFLATKNRSVEQARHALELMEAEAKVRGDIFTDDARGWALYRNGKLADARAALDHATRLGTKEARLLYHAGAIRIASGDVAAGRALVAEALALNPHFDETAAAEARALVGVGAGAKSP